MSYQLVFWKQSPGSPVNAQVAYEGLLDGEHVSDLVPVPGVRFLARVADVFGDGWERLDELNWEGAGGAFQIEVGPQHFLVVGYSLPAEGLCSNQLFPTHLVPASVP